MARYLLQKGVHGHSKCGNQNLSVLSSKKMMGLEILIDILRVFFYSTPPLLYK